MCDTPMDGTPYLWNCWACHDKDHDPETCRVKIGTLRANNDNHCQNCTSRKFQPWSLVCQECHNLYRRAPWMVTWSPCAGKCNRRGIVGRMCRYCAVEDRSTINPYALRLRKGCLGCGAPGYTNDYCSRDCMRGE